MTKFYVSIILIFFIILTPFYSISQHSKIRLIKEDKNYYWGEFYGSKKSSDIKKKALDDMCNKINRQIAVKVSRDYKNKNGKEDRNAEYKTFDKSACNLFDYDEYYDEVEKSWFVCIKKDKIDETNSEQEAKMNYYIDKAINTNDYSEKLRFFYWAKIILKNIPTYLKITVNNSATNFKTINAESWLNDEIKSILDHITCKAVINSNEFFEDKRYLNVEFTINDKNFKNFTFSYNLDGIEFDNQKCSTGVFKIPLSETVLNFEAKAVKIIIDYTYSAYTEDNEINKLITSQKYNDEIYVSAEKHINIPFGRVEIINIPNTYTVKINNIAENISRKTIKKYLFEGTYNLYITKNKYYPLQKSFTIYNNQTKTINLTSKEFALRKHEGGPENGLLSFIIPGLGSYYATRNSNHFYTTAFFVLSVAGAFYFNNQANLNYEKYLVATDQSNISKLYNQAQNNHYLSLFFATVGTGIYIGDIINAFAKGLKTKEIVFTI